MARYEILDIQHNFVFLENTNFKVSSMLSGNRKAEWEKRAHCVYSDYNTNQNSILCIYLDYLCTSITGNKLFLIVLSSVEAFPD